MTKIIAISGSNSSTSINHQVLEYLDEKHEEITLIDLRTWEFPLYSIDVEKTSGIPDQITKLMDVLIEADAVLISTPEHNSSTPAYFKSILDWLSRTGVKYLDGKPTAVMSVAPGKGGAAKAATYVEKLVGHAQAQLISGVHFPSFNDNFKEGEVVNAEWDEKLHRMVRTLLGD